MKSILFNTEMVRAILEGRKTQTRRVVKAGNHTIIRGGTILDAQGRPKYGAELNNHGIFVAPYQKGDILWVREPWTKLYYVDPQGYTHFDQPMYFYAADGTPDITLRDADGFEEPDQRIKWHPCPREAARIFLRVTDVRVERLQDITGADIKAEGAEGKHLGLATRGAFSQLWNSTVKPADRDRFGWEANPWVWVYTFERCEEEAE